MQQVNVCGVDGCSAGWIAVIETSGEIHGEVFSNLESLAIGLQTTSIVAIDIPIGLPDAGDRLCDHQARKFLGSPRASSVFPVPVRGVLQSQNYTEACSAHREIDTRGLSQQAYAILPKIRETDEYLEQVSGGTFSLCEFHPEVSFAAWNGDRPMQFAKKKPEGRIERHSLVNRTWPGVYESIRASIPRKDAKDDDILDAFAGLWTAKRIALGYSSRLPADACFDQRGREMCIHY